LFRRPSPHRVRSLHNYRNPRWKENHPARLPKQQIGSCNHCTITAAPHGKECTRRALDLIFPSACMGDQELALGRGTRRGRTDATHLHRRDVTTDDASLAPCRDGRRRRLVKSRTWWRRRFPRRQPTPPPSAHLPALGQPDVELSSRPSTACCPDVALTRQVLHRSRHRGSPSSSPADPFSISAAFPCTYDRGRLVEIHDHQLDAAVQLAADPRLPVRRLHRPLNGAL